MHSRRRVKRRKQYCHVHGQTEFQYFDFKAAYSCIACEYDSVMMEQKVQNFASLLTT